MTPAILVAFHRWRPLLCDLATEIHPERWRRLGLAEPAVARLLSSPRARQRLSSNLAWILPEGIGQETALAAWRDWDVPLALFAVLPGEKLWQAGLKLGAALFQPEIARLVRRSEVEAFRAGVGEEIHLFALRQASRLWRGGSLPGVEELKGELAPRVASVAALALGAWLTDLPPALAVRVGLKLPPSATDNMAPVENWAPEVRQAWTRAWSGFLSVVSQVSPVEGRKDG